MELGICLPHCGRPIEVLSGAEEALEPKLELVTRRHHHIALEVSYSTYPAIHETIDIIAERLRPAAAA
jgi:hypothetical protein